MDDNYLKVQCPTCKRKLKISRSSLAKSIVCPKCNGRFHLDQQLRPVHRLGEGDLFGPPITDDLSSILESSDDLFADVEKIIDNEQKVETVVAPSRSSDQAIEAPAGVESESAISQDWKNIRKVATKLDESLQRNGIGLMILAFGISAVPIFASKVEALQPILMYMPVVALFVAFLAAFMIAYSLRRGSVSSIILSGLPVLFIGFAAAVAYLFFIDIEPRRVAEKAGAPNANADDIDDPNPLINKEAVINNVVDGFAPPKKTPEIELRPVEPDSGNDTFEVAREPDVPQSPLKPSVVTRGDPVPPDRNAAADLLKQLEKAREISANASKSDVFRNRIRENFHKSLVSEKKVVTGQRYFKNFRMSELIGQQSVYGTAIYSQRPIRGYDIGHFPGLEDRWLDLIVPIVDEPEFADSFVVPEDKILIGVRANLDGRGIIGIQPIMKSENSEQEFGKWIGIATPPNSNQVETLISANGICGFVVYRSQLAAIGLRLVEAKEIKPHIN